LIAWIAELNSLLPAMVFLRAMVAWMVRSVNVMLVILNSPPGALKMLKDLFHYLCKHWLQWFAYNSLRSNSSAKKPAECGWEAWCKRGGKDTLSFGE